MIQIEREKLEKVLVALENSVDLVSNEAREAEKMYVNVPTRLARVQGLVALEVSHEEAITIIKDVLAQPEQEPVAWMHTKIEGVAVPHRPADLDKHPDRWEALYKAPPPCPTCEALARTVMMDQTGRDA